jgi:putative transposase
VAKMLPPHNLSVPQWVRETGIPRDTLYGWRRQALAQGTAPASATPLGTWSRERKFSAVVETASLNELELGEYCRRKGIFPEPLAAWRGACRQANAPLPSKAERAERRAKREQIQELTRELARKDRALAEAAALLVLQKKSGRSGRRPRPLPPPGAAHRGERGHHPGPCRGGPPGPRRRGRGTDPAHLTARAPRRDPPGRCAPPRASARGPRLQPGQSPRGARTRCGPGGGPRAALRKPPAPPDRDHPGRRGPLHRLRGDLLPHPARRRPTDPAGSQDPTQAPPAALGGTGPHPVWRWDITYLATTVRGTFFYLYLILDLYSRKIVGWEVYPEKSAEVFQRAHLREAVGATDRVLHSDNGSPMKGATRLATLQHLGVVPSFSRPSVSNDNPYSEAIFATCKGCPAFPEKPCTDLPEARTWTAGFVIGYNETHRHSVLKFVTPDQRHRGQDHYLLAQRDALYQAARAENPERWSGPTRNWDPPTSVLLNPGKPRPPRTQPRSLHHDPGRDPRPPRARPRRSVSPAPFPTAPGPPAARKT